MTAGFASRLRLDVTAYRRSFCQFADDDVFLNTGVSFPVAFDSARIRGVDTKLTLLPVRRVSGFASYSLLEGTARLPIVGGLFVGEDALDELDAAGRGGHHAGSAAHARGQVRYAATERLWLASTIRYGSGLPVELDAGVDQAETCRAVRRRPCEPVDFEPAVCARTSASTWGGPWPLAQRTASAHLRVEAANVTNRLNVINFAGCSPARARPPPQRDGADAVPVLGGVSGQRSRLDSRTADQRLFATCDLRLVKRQCVIAYSTAFTPMAYPRGEKRSK